MNGFHSAFIQERNAAAFLDCDVVRAAIRVNGERNQNFPGPSALSRKVWITQVLPQMSLDEAEMGFEIGASPIASQRFPISHTPVCRTSP